MGALVDSVGRGGKVWTFSCWHSWVSIAEVAIIRVGMFDRCSSLTSNWLYLL